MCCTNVHKSEILGQFVRDFYKEILKNLQCTDAAAGAAPYPARASGMIPGMEGEPGGVFRGRSVTFIFRYALISEKLFSSELGHYRSFGIRAFQKTECGWREVAFVSDVSTDRAAVEQLARRCTEGQLDPIHLLDVVEDAL